MGYKYNIFRKMARELEYMGRVNQFNVKSIAVLEPERMVNRALWGTDYRPNDVRLQYEALLSYTLNNVERVAHPNEKH